MTVAELIMELKKRDPTMLVVMSRDSEGNGHSPLSDLGDGVYDDETKWSGDFWGDDDAKEEGKTGLPAAVCLWPVN